MPVELPSVDPGMTKTPPGSNEPPANTRGPMTEPAVRRKEKREQKRADEARRERWARVHKEALKRFKLAMQADSDNRKEALEDLRFKAGDQWPKEIKSQRASDERPCLTVNTIPTLVRQITNDIRENRPAIAVSPVGDQSDKESAQLFAGMIRAIERDSAADIAYDTAVTSATDIGFGYWRILTEYESPTSFNQVITIKRVRNPFTVYLDPLRQEPDGSDAEWGFVTEVLPKEELKQKYPDASPMNLADKGIGDDLKEWVTKDGVRIAEYFTTEREPTRLVQLSNGHIGLYDELDPSVQAQVQDGSLQIANERQADQVKVVWYKMTGTEILSEKPWAGRWIPIIEVVGEEIDVEGKVIRSGAIRNAKDPQRMKNYWLSYKTETVALRPKTPVIGAEGQFEGYEDDWRDAARRSRPYLEYVPVSLDGSLAPPPQLPPPAQVPAGVVEAEQSAERDMMSTTGIRFNANPLLERIPDESGLALRELRRNNDIGSFHYRDNLNRSLRHSGRVLIDLIPKIYDTRRVITILREDDTEQQLTLEPTLGAPLQKQPNGKQLAARLLFNPKVGQYGVTVTTGPSYATKRIEAQQQMMAFAKAMPQKGELIAHLIAKYSDWPGSDEIYKLLLKTLPPQLLTPDMNDLPPQVQQLIQSLMQQMQMMMVQRMQMLRDLTSTREDQATKRLKVERDFEAKLLNIFMQLRTKATQFTPSDLSEAQALATQYPQGFPTGIPDPMQTASQVQPTGPGAAQAPGAIPGLNMQGQLPPGVAQLPVMPPPR